MWLGAIEGLDAAMKRMNERAQEHPGPYFVYSAENMTVFATIDTSADGGQDKAARAGGGGRTA
jgi:hypothetical protein